MPIEFLPYLKVDITVTILGWAFKMNTNDSRESAAIYVTAALLEKGIIVQVYDLVSQRMKMDLELLFEAQKKTKDKELLDLLKIKPVLMQH